MAVYGLDETAQTSEVTLVEALEYLRRKVADQPDLAEVTVSARFIRAVLAQPQEGGYTEAEECAHQIEVWCNVFDTRKNKLLRQAVRLLRCRTAESPAQSAPAQEPPCGNVDHWRWALRWLKK